jgi:hypothetical protein
LVAPVPDLTVDSAPHTTLTSSFARRLRAAGPPVVLWLAAGLVFSEISGRVTDWYTMTDELVWERLAISVARSGSLVPSVHGTYVGSLDQLYPWLLASLFRTSSVLHDLHRAHLLGAWAMSSACIPAYLLARRVTHRAWPAVFVAVLSVAVPWMIYSTMLLTEVVAYPVFLWTLLALQSAVVRPSPRNDVLLVGALGLAFGARTQFVCLVPVPPLVFAAGAFRGVGFRRTLREHPLLWTCYAAAAVSVIGLVAAGGNLHGLSAEGGQVKGSLVSAGLASGFVGSLAQLAFPLGVLPFVVGAGWMLARLGAPSTDPELQTFALIGLVTTLALTAVVARFDLSAAAGGIFDRYLFYLVPVVLIAFLAALREARLPLWSLLVSLLAVCAGFVFKFQASFTWADPYHRLDPDSPVSIIYKSLIDAVGSERGAKIALVAATCVLTALFAAATRVRRLRSYVAVLLTAAVAVGLPVESGYLFSRLLGTIGNSFRPLTGDASHAAGLDWVDRAVGAHADVTEIPYSVSSAWFVSLNYWRDLEFWNKSVDRDAAYPSTGQYAYTGIWFPKLNLAFNPTTGSGALSPSRYVVQSVTESRFRVAGRVLTQTQAALLIDAPRPWRLAWMTFGATDDGWLTPGVIARIRVFATSPSRGRATYSLTLQIGAPDGVSGRPFTVASNLRHVTETATASDSTTLTVPVCVARGRYSDVTVKAAGDSAIPGDLSSLAAASEPRQGSIQLRDISVSDDIGPACTPS